MQNLCVLCGMPIPEGVQFCKGCDEKTKQKKKKSFDSIKERTKTAAYREFAERLTEFYTDDSITDDMHITVGVIKANIADLLKMLESEVVE